MNTTGKIDCTALYGDYPETTEKNTCHVCLSTGAVVGLSFHAQMGLVSLTALLVLLAIIALKYYRNRALPVHSRWPLFRSNVDILMLNLIIADILMSFGAISDVYWAHHRQVFCGSYCNAQGVLQTMGETSAALSTLAVAVYTFLAIQRDRYPSYRPRACLGVVTGIWLWVLLWAVIPLAIKRSHDLDENGGVQNYYTPTPWWCWINGKYLPEKIVAEYLWLWIAGIGSVALYVPAYFTVRNRQPTAGSDVQQEPGEEQRGGEARSIASSINKNNSEAAKMLWYPLVYTLCVLPLSIIRWAGFVHPKLLTSAHILSPSMVFSSIFNLMGLFNVLLIWWTRPAILLLDFDGEPNQGGSEVSLDQVVPHVTRVTSRAPTNLNQRTESRHDKEMTDETLGQPRNMNRFGAPEVSWTREF
ncbi:G protein coupled glucose receptor regulating Gpa2 protein [Ceratobasidium sp. AG-Ba]|nr:G protein coupled glucose receptor regulating Gpa2 protein [Ceratobasidium sp. AG-Ba]